MCKSIRFVRYGDLVMINDSSLPKLGFTNSEELKESLLKLSDLKRRFRCQRIAIKSHINNDDFRSPNVIIIGEDKPDPWVIHTDNGIRYSFDVTKSMFCKGNIKEKIRLSKIDCTNEIVVDLFAGIGYFAMVFAVHCNAKMVYCCEWNPIAVETLKRNAELNKVNERIHIVEGDNQIYCPIKIANRINMGLIPTSLNHLSIACRALNPIHDKLYLHIHENLNYLNDSHMSSIKMNKIIIEEKRKIWSNSIADKVYKTMLEEHSGFSWSIEILDMNCIKSYAPHIDHMVVDILCYKKKFK